MTTPTFAVGNRVLVPDFSDELPFIATVCAVDPARRPKFPVLLEDDDGVIPRGFAFDELEHIDDPLDQPAASGPAAHTDEQTPATVDTPVQHPAAGSLARGVTGNDS